MLHSFLGRITLPRGSCAQRSKSQRCHSSEESSEATPRVKGMPRSAAPRTGQELRPSGRRRPPPAGAVSSSKLLTLLSSLCRQRQGCKSASLLFDRRHISLKRWALREQGLNILPTRDLTAVDETMGFDQ